MLKKSINFFNSKIFIFILIFVIALVSFTLYKLFANEENIGFNFQPYPEFSPKDIPDINIGSDSCYKVLKKCDEVGKNCSQCSSDYICTKVEREGQYIIDNKSVPIGKYCLPKLGNDEKCNKYTGAWVWVNDPEYCAQKGDQCWRCICKYPDLFGGDDCSTQTACTPPSQSSLIFETLPNGVLVTTDELQKDTADSTTDYEGIKSNTIYDPNKEAGTPDEIRMLEQNLYGKNSDNKPYFKCNCTVDPNTKKKLINLPNDPYTCHLSLCDPKSEIEAKFFKDDKGNDVLKCDCSNGGLYIIDPAINKVYGNTCDDGKQACNYEGAIGTIGPEFDQDSRIITGCNCGSGDSKYYSRKCKSSTTYPDKDFCYEGGVKIPQCNPEDTKTLPLCRDPNNKIGYECVDACYNVKCSENGTLVVKQQGDIKICTCQCKAGYKGTDCSESCDANSDCTATQSQGPPLPPIHVQGDCSKCCAIGTSGDSPNMNWYCTPIKY
jgi:hypothetical protein